MRSDPNQFSKTAEYSPTNRGPNIDPKTENQTAKDKAVALKLSDATNEATYLVWRAAAWPIPKINAPINRRINESIINEEIWTSPPKLPTRKVFDRALFLENFCDILSNIWVPITAPATPTAFGNPIKYGFDETSLAANTVIVTAAINPVEEKATESNKWKIFFTSEIIKLRVINFLN